MSEGAPRNTQLPPPLYEGDCGWTPENEAEAQKIWDRINNGEDKKTVLNDMTKLIDKIEARVRSHPDRGHGLITNDSVLLTTLLATYYSTSKQVDRS